LFQIVSIILLFTKSITTVSQNDLYDYLSDWMTMRHLFYFLFFTRRIDCIFSLEDFSKEQSHTECGIALVDEQYYGQVMSQVHNPV